MFWLCFIFYNNTISYQMQGKKKGTALQSLPHLLFHDLRYYACTYRASAFANCKTQAFFHCNLHDQLDRPSLTLSPGITISTPSGSSITPVTSVVLK